MRHFALCSVLAWLLTGCPGEFDPDLSDLDLDFDGEQPERGLYSACSEEDDCVTRLPGPHACMGTGADGTTLPDDGWAHVPEGQRGFCTRFRDPPEDPAVDCLPHPGGHVTAELAFGQNSRGLSFCVLDCAGGLSCPSGMECRHVHTADAAYDALICL